MSPHSLTAHVHRAMESTPFQEPACREWLESRGISFVATPDDAAWIVADIRPRLLPYAAKFGARKRYLLWTHEPRRDVALASSCRLTQHAEARVMNVYTGDIYMDNLFYLFRWIASGHIQPPVPPLETDPDFPPQDRHRRRLRPAVLRAGPRRQRHRSVRLAP